MSCLDEAHHQVDPLVSTGVHSGMLEALTSIGSHYDGMDYRAVGQGYSSKKSNNELLAIGNSTTHGAKVLASKMPEFHMCALFVKNLLGVYVNDV